MFNNIFGGDDDDNDDANQQQQPAERNTQPQSQPEQPREAPDPSETVHGGHDPMSPDYRPDFDPSTGEGQMGKEVMIFGEDGAPYAGEWPRNMFETAYENPRQATWIGYKSNPQEGLREIPIEHNSWFRHAAVFGTTGYGKTTFLKNIMIQWAYAGWGFCFIDPKGDGVMDLMQELPEHRLDDVIWIDPAPEDSERVVGINFLQPGTEGSDEEQAAEKESIIDDLENIIKNESYWGPRMASVFSTLARGMIESEKNYTLLDMYQVLVDEEYREMFVEDVDDPLVRQYTRQIAEEMDQSDLDALIRRLKRLVNNNITREIISHKESSFRIRDAVENGKIILIKNDQDNADAQQMIATGLMRRIWAAIKARKEVPEEERTPFFLIVDEFDDVVTENADIDKMLSKARSFRLSVTLCNQQPSQLPQDIQQAIMGNCDNLLSFNPNNPADARLIMKKFGDYNAKDLMNLGRFKVFTRISVNAEQSPPFITHTFADYPPLRTYEEAHEAIERSLEKYGTDRLDPKQIAQDVVLDMDESEPGAENNPDSPGAASELKQEHGDDDADNVNINEQDILESIYALELKQNAKGEFLPVKDVKEELLHRLNEDMYQSVPAEAVEQLNESPHVDKERRDNELQIRLTSEGRQQVVDMTSGSVATGGGDDHRYILKRAFEAFTMADYKVTIPEQEGKEQPDGIAEIPMDMSASNPAEMKAKMDELENEYPTVHRISEGNDLNIEAETTTINKPKQTLTNLRKAIEAGRKCVFCVKDMEAEKGDMAYHAKRGASILMKPPYVRGINRRKDLREFYNKSSILEVEDGGRAIRPKSSGRQTVWRETPDDGVALYDRKSNDVIQKFDSVNQATNPTKDDVPAYYRYDQSKNAFIVYVNQGNSRDRKVYTEKEHLKEEWTPIREPFIPEEEFPRQPREDDWMFVIFPDDDKDIPPQIYEPTVTTDGITGELKPLIPEDLYTTNEPEPEPADPEPEPQQEQEQQAADTQQQPTPEPDTDPTPEPEPEQEPTTEPEPEPDSDPEPSTDTVEEPEPTPAETEFETPDTADTTPDADDEDLDYRDFTLVYDGLNDLHHILDEDENTLCGDYVPPEDTEETTNPTEYDLCDTCKDEANIED